MNLSFQDWESEEKPSEYNIYKQALDVDYMIY